MSPLPSQLIGLNFFEPSIIRPHAQPAYYLTWFVSTGDYHGTKFTQVANSDVKIISQGEFKLFIIH
jgi:hypothetical protein